MAMQKFIEKHKTSQTAKAILSKMNIAGSFTISLSYTLQNNSDMNSMVVSPNRPESNFSDALG